MKLKKLMLKYRIEPIQLAVALKCSIASIYRYMKGEKMHFKRAKQIEEFFNNEVTVEELLNLNDRKT